MHTVINCPDKGSGTQRSPAFFPSWDRVFSSGPVHSRALGGAQIAILLGICKSSFQGFGAFMQLAMPFILMFLFVLAGLFICLFVCSVSLCLELLRGEEFLLNELVFHHLSIILIFNDRHSTSTLTASLLIWPDMAYYSENVKSAFSNSFQMIKIDVIESRISGSLYFLALQGEQTCSTWLTPFSVPFWEISIYVSSKLTNFHFRWKETFHALKLFTLSPVLKSLNKCTEFALASCMMSVATLQEVHFTAICNVILC